MSAIRYTVTLSARALRDLADVRTYITAQGLPLTAERFADKVADAIEELEIFPHRGRPAGRGERELVVVPTYVVRYRVRGRDVQIIHLKHSARR